MSHPRTPPSFPACALLVGLLLAGDAPAGTYPDAGGSQDFSNFTESNGLVTFNDGSSVYPTVNGGYNASAVTVADGALVLTDLTPSNIASRYQLPVIDAGKEVASFTLTFSLKIAAPDPAANAHGEGFSVNFGSIGSGTGSGETGFSMANGLTIGWDTRDNGGEEPSVRVYANASLAGEVPASQLGAAWAISDSDNPVPADFREVVVHWDADGLDLTWGGTPVFTDLETPGFVPSVNDKFAFAARTSDNVQVLAIDNISIATTAVDASVTGGPVISEFLASNQRGLEDEDFDHPDWIEIYNGQNSAMSLDGWFLTNNALTPQLWRIPAITLPPFGYVYFFASGKNRTESLHRHTSFTLPKEGGYLALVRPDGVTAHGITYPVQFEDIPYGVKGVNLEPGYFDTATPGARNATRLYNGVVTEAPVILNAEGNPAVSGMITASTTLSIAPPATPGGYVRYLTNGNLPIETPSTSPLYSGPVSVTNRSLVLRARVFAPGMVPGPASTVSQVFLGPDLVSYRNQNGTFGSNLPVMVMDSFGYNVDGITNPTNTNRAIFRYTWTQVFDPARGSSPGTARLSDTPAFQGPSGTHVRGQSSSGFPQTPYALELWDDNNEDEDHPLLGMPAGSDWVLYNPYNEETFMRNVLIYNTLRQWRADGAAMRTRFVEVFFNQQNNPVTYADYRGVYVLIEKIKRGSNRVRIEKLNGEVTDPALITGGYMFKKDKPPQARTINVSSNGPWGSQTYEVIEPSVPNSAQSTWLRTHVQAFDSTLMSGNWLNESTGYRQYIDTSSFADNQLWVEIFKNIDGYRISTYFYKSREGKITALPAWDYNLAAGNGNYLGGENPVGWYYSHISGGNLPFWPRLIQDPGYVLEMWDRYWQIRRQVLTDDRIAALVDGWASDLTAGDPRPVLNTSRPASPPAASDFDTPASRHFYKYRTLGVYNWPNANNFSLRTSFQSEIEFLKEWMKQRLEWMEFKSLDQIPSAAGKLRPPNLHESLSGAERYTGSVPAGLRMKLTDPNAVTASIYYTVNGSDPRLPGGAIDPSALIQSGGAAAKEVLLANGSAWKYLGTTSSAALPDDAGGKSWKEAAFLDAAWSSGPTPIGYGEGGLATTLSGAGVTPSGNGNQVTYLRSSFTVADPSAVYELRADLNVDDGAVIYLNGQEAYRHNMPYQPVVITPSVRAQGAIDPGLGDYETENVAAPVRLPASLLVAGVNSIAVEVHQFQYGSGNTGISSSTDMRFNLQLTALTVAPVAEPLALGNSGLQQVRARVRAGSFWSPLTLGSFVVDAVPASTGNLVVSEFLYDPAAPNPDEVAAGANNSNDFEFIEITNISGGSVDLTGVRIENAIVFDFTTAPESLRILPAGGRVLVVENLAAFNARWPGRSAQIAGVFASGNLSNGGELFSLRGADGSLIRQFTWDNKEPWPSIAARSPAAGQPDYSLVLNNPLSGPDHNDPHQWRASASSHGNPGGADALPMPANPTADSNGNGRADLLDYVFPDSGLPQLSLEAVDSGSGPEQYPVMRMTRNLAADGYSMVPETSTNLSDWTPGGAVWLSNTWNGDGTVTGKWRFTSPASAAGPRYLRLRVKTE